MADDERERGPFERVWWERVQSGAHFGSEGDDLWQLENKAIAERLATMVAEHKGRKAMNKEICATCDHLAQNEEWDVDMVCSAKPDEKGWCPAIENDQAPCIHTPSRWATMDSPEG